MKRRNALERDLAGARAIIESIAPKDRAHGWHMEECRGLGEELRGDDRVSLIEDIWAKSESGYALMNQLQASLQAKNIDHHEYWRLLSDAAMTWWRETQPNVGRPFTDTELCEPSCVYPQAREWLERNG